MATISRKLDSSISEYICNSCEYEETSNVDIFCCYKCQSYDVDVFTPVEEIFTVIFENGKPLSAKKVIRYKVCLLNDKD